ncbi:hypothetical protein CSOJ01_01464 [Colletotrichum sojae]|uniref:Uncharacterized protein n=1 Tax=Colletotrichum sojae TaxID=2175907 RepID=A0A8H6N3L8_9PEZI|nr:hypothetical protein CSOJ01_01464 [Colletotrichum sojae]
MKPTLLALAALWAWAAAMPQEAPPQVPPTSTSFVVVIVTGQQPAPTEPIPNIPEVPVPTQPIPNLPPAPAPAPPSDPAQPAPVPAPAPGGAHCVCGATYCGGVLIGFQGYTLEQLNQGYCATPGTDCASAPPTALEDTLFVCICNPGEKEGSTIELICPCQGRCKNDQPDRIGRCEVPCNLGCAPAAPSIPTTLPEQPGPVIEPLPPVEPQPVPAPAPPRVKRHH